MNDSNGVYVKFGGDASGAITAAQDAADAVKKSIDGMKGTFESLGGVMEAVQGPFLAISAILAGGAIFTEAINETAAYSGEVRKLTNIFGITAENASKLAVELKLVGISTEEYTGMAMKLDRQLKNNESGINQMGVATRDSSGALLSQQDIMKNAASVLSGYKAGTDRNEAALYLFGKGAEEASKLLKMNNESHERAAALATQLGLVLTNESQSSVKKYQMSMRETGLVFDSFMDKIGESVMPALTDLARMPLVIIPCQAIQIAFAAINEICISLKAGLDLVIISLKTFSNVANATLRLDWAGAKTAFDNGAKELEQSMTRHGQHMVDVAKNTATSVAEAWGLMDKEPEQSQPSGGKPFAAPDKGNGDSKIQVWKAELEQKKEEEGNFFKSSLEMEEHYWAEKLALISGNSKHDISLRRQVQHELYAIHKQQETDERATQDEILTAKKKMAKLELDGEKEKLRLLKEMGDISDADYLQAMSIVNDKEYETQLKALQDKLALYEQDKKAKQKINNDIEALEKEHALSLQKINDDVMIAQKNQYAQMLSPISSAIDKSVTGMIQGTITAQKALSNIWQSILGEFTSMLSKQLTQWVAGEAVKTATSKTGSAIRQALGIEETAATVAEKTIEGTAVVGVNAAEAASGAAAAVAPTPFIGPGLAAAAFAGTMAMVLGAKSLFSAKGGFDIPAGANPLTQLHENEMVLPAHIAQPLRNALAGIGSSIGSATSGFGLPSATAMGQTTSSSSGNSAQSFNGSMPKVSEGDTHSHLHVHAVDAPSVERLFRDNGHLLAREMRRQARNFAPTKA